MTLREVANKLAAKSIGAIITVGVGGEVTGIISERDIIRALSMHGPDWHLGADNKMRNRPNQVTRYSGIQMSLNAMRVLRAPGLERSPRRQAIRPPSWAHRVWDTGSICPK